MAPPLEVVPRSQLLGASVKKKHDPPLNFGELVLEEKLFLRAQIQDPECLFRETSKNDVILYKKKVEQVENRFTYEEKRVENPNPKISISGIRWTLYIISLCIWDQVTQLFVNRGINLPHVSQKYPLLSPETFVRVAPHLINETLKYTRWS